MFRNLFRPTVDSLLSSFVKTSQRLHDLSDTLLDEASNKEAEAISLQIEAKDARLEAQRAYRSARKIEDIIA